MIILYLNNSVGANIDECIEIYYNGSINYNVIDNTGDYFNDSA